MRWRFWVRPNGHAAQLRREAELQRDRTRRATPAMERLADAVADLPDEEFVARVARAFRPRST